VRKTPKSLVAYRIPFSHLTYFSKLYLKMRKEHFLALSLLFLSVEPLKAQNHLSDLQVKSTALQRVGMALPQMSPKLRGSALAGQIPTIREDILKILSEKGTLHADFEVYQAPFEAKEKQYVQFCKTRGLDGALVWKIDMNTVNVRLRSCFLGHTLAEWSFPSPTTNQLLQQLPSLIGNEILRTIPYLALIKKFKGRRAIINAGKQQGLQAGDFLRIFDFEDKRPTFYSSQTELGIAKVLKTTEDQALIELTKKTKPLHILAKVSRYISAPTQFQNIEQRHFNGFWVSPGVRYLIMDSQTSEAQPAAKRKYKIPLAPLYSLGLGYNNFLFEILYNKTTASSNQLNYMELRTQWDFYTKKIANKISWDTGVGLHYQQIQILQTGSPEWNSSTTYYPYVDSGLSYRTTPNTRLFTSVQLGLPISSQDIDNGASQSASNYSLGFKAGGRAYLSSSWILEGDMRYKMQTIQLPAESLTQIELSTGVSVDYLF